MDAVQELLPRFIHPDRYSDIPLISTIEAMANTVGSEGFLRQQRAMMNRIDSRPSLTAIACPTLVLCGREDALTPLELSLEIASQVPNATLVVIPECGHLSTLERPRAVSEQLGIWLEV